MISKEVEERLKKLEDLREHSPVRFEKLMRSVDNEHAALDKDQAQAEYHSRERASRTAVDVLFGQRLENT